MSTTIKVNLDSVQTILNKRGLEPGGKASLVMTEAIHRFSNDYTPFDNNALSTTVTVTPNTLTYVVPYAQYQWYGQVMVGNAPKVAIDKALKYQGSPMRGKCWVTRAMIDRKQDVITEVENYIKKNPLT